MPSMFVTGGLLALSGLAAAFPQGGFTNGTTSANSTAPAGSVGTSTPGSMSNDPVTESLFCPNLNGNVIQSKTGISNFLLQCSTSYFGIVIDVQFNSTSFVNKRQTAVAPANIQDCIAACDGVPSCVGTGFNVADRTCTLYSSLGASFARSGVDFAVRVATGAPTTATAGQVLTSTVYATTVQTISSCAPTVTNCPVNAVGPVVYTALVPVSSTVYVCPAATVIPVAPVACQCAYGQKTVTVYSQSGTTVVAVKTTVVAVPSGSATTNAVTTVQATGSAVTTAPTTVAATATAGGNSGSATAGGNSGSATTSSKLTSFTGAASNVQAGMGLLAGVAGLAFML